MSPMRTDRLLIAVLCLATAAACGGAASPTTPSASPAVNAAPSVKLTTVGAASCNPAGRASGCSVNVRAVAVDPDNDTLTYAWSGTTPFTSGDGYCRPGATPDAATCSLQSPEQIVVASVIPAEGPSLGWAQCGAGRPPSSRLPAPR